MSVNKYYNQLKLSVDETKEISKFEMNYVLRAMFRLLNKFKNISKYREEAESIIAALKSYTLHRSISLKHPELSRELKGPGIG